jgi:hypothetical protein
VTSCIAIVASMEYAIAGEGMCLHLNRMGRLSVIT